MRIAYLTGRAWRGRPLPAGALPALDAPDHAAIVRAGAALGLAFEVRCWDDPDLVADGFAAAVVRSCWDYVERCDAFVAAVESIAAAGLPVFNRPEAIRWNVSKRYLEALGPLAIPTRWARAVDAAEVRRAFDAFDAPAIVVKPQVGAGSRSTVRLVRGAWREADLARAPAGPAMLQPYCRSIEDEGEWSLVWFGGGYSHAVRKVPHPGTWLANSPETTRVVREDPPADAVVVARDAAAKAPRDVLYLRVDLVRGNDGRWRVIELEAVEPRLYLAQAPEGADVFVRALRRALTR